MEVYCLGPGQAVLDCGHNLLKLRVRRYFFMIGSSLAVRDGQFS